jgi:ABC-type multidrug transport system ATPase subunit
METRQWQGPGPGLAPGRGSTSGSREGSHAFAAGGMSKPGYGAGHPGHGHGHGHGPTSGGLPANPLEALSFDGKDFRYHLHWELYGLHQAAHPVVGFCRSGELFGILSVGERKTNMLKSLSGVIEKSKESKVTLFVNGKVSGNSWARSSHLCPGDDDILYRNLSVIETLLFSSELRVDNHGHDEITALRLLASMELDHISDCRVSSLSAWQRRMVVFATEIVAGQDLIFFDRPTLDLDATSALACVTALQRVARTGVLIAITSDFLSFREYAILDRIQLLTGLGSIFFGAGARYAMRVCTSNR